MKPPVEGAPDGPVLDGDVENVLLPSLAAEDEEISISRTTTNFPQAYMTDGALVSSLLLRPPSPSRKSGSPRDAVGRGRDWYVRGCVGGMHELDASTASTPMVLEM